MRGLFLLLIQSVGLGPCGHSRCGLCASSHSALGHVAIGGVGCLCPVIPPWAIWPFEVWTVRFQSFRLGPSGHSRSGLFDFCVYLVSNFYYSADFIMYLFYVHCFVLYCKSARLVTVMTLQTVMFCSHQTMRRRRGASLGLLRHHATQGSPWAWAWTFPSTLRMRGG